jgi:hypothetical protein
MGAIGAEFGAVALVIGGYVQGDQEGLDRTDRDEDRVLAGRFGRDGFRPRRYLIDRRAERVVLRAFAHVRQIIDQKDGPARVLVVTTGVPMSAQDVRDVSNQVQAHPAVPYAPFLLGCWRTSGALPVPVAER